MGGAFEPSNPLQCATCLPRLAVHDDLVEPVEPPVPISRRAAWLRTYWIADLPRVLDRGEPARVGVEDLPDLASSSVTT
jgi:hypothetical protein